MTKLSIALARFGDCVCCGLNLAWHRDSRNRQLTCAAAGRAYQVFQASRRAGESVAVKHHDLDLPSDFHGGEA